jgi:hypothetical protein
LSADVTRIVDAASEIGSEVVVGGQAITGAVRRSLPKKVKLIPDMDILVDYVLDRFPSTKV